MRAVPYGTKILDPIVDNYIDMHKDFLRIAVGNDRLQRRYGTDPHGAFTGEVVRDRSADRNQLDAPISAEPAKIKNGRAHRRWSRRETWRRRFALLAPIGCK